MATRQAVESSLLTLRVALKHNQVYWQPPEKLHLTLRFFAQLPENKIVTLLENVRHNITNLPPFTLHFGQPQLFPNLHHPRLIVLEIPTSTALKTLAAMCNASAMKLGFLPETQSFRPHITLGRLKTSKWPTLSSIQGPAIAPMPVNYIVLYQSIMKGPSTVYQPLHALSLASKDT